MTEAKTPTPWYVSGFEAGAGGDSRVVMGADGFSIAHVMDRTPMENAADADFIVKAVNAFKEMKKALTAASHARRSYQYGNSAPDLAQSTADLCDAALSGTSNAVEPILSGAEKKAQGARCGCQGVDDYCPCQNAPDRETRRARTALAARKED
ncbi:hypothetical protein [Allomesorhizobium camelthorni]|uniref:Uncharacterized protein n=1 Tax=Allomesorhizobium camelthorni TaxID=475069 RepID=A0A6G4W797_9HYPH|nr:hypothetical protein [Mesorhizobium camelthorni]NGO50479.1 hypothetical protein [Mesorhizobium camelthorni]